MKKALFRGLDKDITLISPGIYIFYRYLRAQIFKKRNNHHNFLSYSDFNEWRPKNLFIMGSGSSINLLEERKFQKIKKEYSIGVNMWVLHDFIPDIYSIEHTNSDDKKIIFDTFFTSEKAIESKPLILHDWSTINHKGEFIYSIDPVLKKNLRLYTGINIPAKSSAQLNRLNKFLIPSILKYFHPSMLFSKNTNIVRMTYLGFLLGFENIIYLGVDLNKNPHFWDEKKEYIQKFGFNKIDNEQKGEIHNTEAKEYGIPASDIIKSLSTYSYLHGTKLWLGTENSKLETILPKYEW